tara:strand:+ start:1330 stop:1752 length:423 start_codon:yes stop_codon:yes gene_type:complete
MQKQREQNRHEIEQAKAESNNLLRSTREEMEQMRMNGMQNLDNALKRKRIEHKAAMSEKVKQVKKEIKEAICNDSLDKYIERVVKVNKVSLEALAKKYGLPCNNVPTMRTNIATCMKLDHVFSNGFDQDEDPETCIEELD